MIKNHVDKIFDVDKSKLKKILVAIFIIFIFSVVFALINIGNNKIHKNIKIEGIDVSGKTQEEADEIITKAAREKRLKQLKLKHEDYEITISYDQLSIMTNESKAAKEAYSVGRESGIIKSNYEIISTLFVNRNIEIHPEIDDQALENTINDVEMKLPDVIKESTYYLENDNLIIKAGTSGVKIKKEELKNEIIRKIKNLTDTNNEIEIPVEKIDAKEIDIAKIYEEIKKEPQNAYISENPKEIHAEENGIDFGISMEEVKKILEEEKEEYVIPIITIQPEITVADLGEEAFTDKLASYTTNYDASNINRNNNLVLAAEKLNGTIVNPGKTFSYNETIGERTISAGFKQAQAYANGNVVLDVGGGICQLSSTLYNAALLTNLEITERHSHYFKTSYVPEGRDATVSWGSVDFKFENNRRYPIKIIAKCEDGVTHVEIYGVKQEDDFDVLIDSEVTSIIKRNIDYKEDNSLNYGSELIEREGTDGCTSETYKTLLKNGIVASKSLISKDTYNPLSKVIRRNT